MAKLVISLDGAALGEYVLDKPKLTVGRAASNDVHLDDGTVSGKHAVFQVVGSDVFVEDLGSTNGTQVNGSKVQRRELRHGDLLRIGQHELRFIDESVAALDATVIIAPAQREAIKPQGPGAGALKILNGPKAGESLELNKAYNTVGKPGGQMAVVAKRAQGYFLVPMAGGAGEVTTRINDKPVGANSVPLKNGDVLEVAGIRLEFLQKS